MADEEEEICRTSKAHCKRNARVSPGKVGRSDSVMLLLSIDVSSRCSICKCNRGLTLAPLADGLYRYMYLEKRSCQLFYYCVLYLRDSPKAEGGLRE